jgi:hypothetical protein
MHEAATPGAGFDGMANGCGSEPEIQASGKIAESRTDNLALDITYTSQFFNWK